MTRSSRAAPDAPPVLFDIDALDLEGHGVARREGKVAFVRGALPGERVSARIVRSKPRFDVAETLEVLRENPSRVAPRCPHFGVCGGCSLQHLEPRAQVSIKGRSLEDTLWHVGRVRPETISRPVVGPAWGYRFRARLSVRHVPKKGGVLVGFHERGSSYVADIRECHVVPPRVSALLLPLRALIAGLSIKDRLPQLELAVGEERDETARPAACGSTASTADAAAPSPLRHARRQVIALVARVLEPPTESDRALLRAFGIAHDIEWWLQPKGPDSIELLDAASGAASRLAYRLDEFGIVMPYRPTDFTQVNHAVNAVLVGQAIRLLDPRPEDRIADLFCGLGNFTLPLATRCARVLGVEGSATLVARAADAAVANGLSSRTDFAQANLFELTPQDWAGLGPFDRVLVDPPREGALAVAKALSDPAMPRCWSTTGDGCCVRRAWSTCSRRPRTSSRSPSSSPAWRRSPQRPEPARRSPASRAKKGPPGGGPLVGYSAAPAKRAGAIVPRRITPGRRRRCRAASAGSRRRCRRSGRRPRWQRRSWSRRR